MNVVEKSGPPEGGGLVEVWWWRWSSWVGHQMADRVVVFSQAGFKINTIYQPNAGKICKWLVDLLHSSAKKTMVIY